MVSDGEKIVVADDNEKDVSIASSSPSGNNSSVANQHRYTPSVVEGLSEEIQTFLGRNVNLEQHVAALKGTMKRGEQALKAYLTYLLEEEKKEEIEQETDADKDSKTKPVKDILSRVNDTICNEGIDGWDAAQVRETLAELGGLQKRGDWFVKSGN